MTHRALSTALLMYYTLLSAPPEMYAGTTKEFSSDFIWKQEATLTEHVSKFVLSSQTTAFAPLDSSLKLARFSLPPLKEKVI